MLKLYSKNKNMKEDNSTLVAQRNSFAEGVKTVQINNDSNFVLPGSEISKTQEKVKAIRDVVENRFAAMSGAIDQITLSLNYFAFYVVHTKHFSNLLFKVENCTSYLDLVYITFKPTEQILFLTEVLFIHQYHLYRPDMSLVISLHPIA